MDTNEIWHSIEHVNTNMDMKKRAANIDPSKPEWPQSINSRKKAIFSSSSDTITMKQKNSLLPAIKRRIKHLTMQAISISWSNKTSFHNHPIQLQRNSNSSQKNQHLLTRKQANKIIRSKRIHDSASTNSQKKPLIHHQTQQEQTPQFSAEKKIHFLSTPQKPANQRPSNTNQSRIAKIGTCRKKAQHFTKIRSKNRKTQLPSEI